MQIVSIFFGFPLWVNTLEQSRCSLPSGLVLNSNELSLIFRRSIAGSLFAPSTPGHTWGALMWKWWGFSIMQQLPLHKREMGQAVPQDLFNCSTPHFPFLWVSSILRQLKYCLLSSHMLPEAAITVIWLQLLPQNRFLVQRSRINILEGNLVFCVLIKDFWNQDVFKKTCVCVRERDKFMSVTDLKIETSLTVESHRC